MSGRVVTFFSWKGGVGRTMALANVGIQLARRGKRVLLVDWDLEAPGLDRYFVAADEGTKPLLRLVMPSDRTGLLGLLVEAAATSATPSLGSWQRRCIAVDIPQIKAANDIKSIAASPLHLLPSGAGRPDYAPRLHSFSWSSFFEDAGGGGWLEDLRNQWRATYDFVLIDGRTGLADSTAVSTVQMPDALVFVFTANSQSLDDGLRFVEGIQSARAAFPLERSQLTIIPLLARWEGDREVDLADAWLARIEAVVGPLVDGWLPSDVPVRRMLERLRVPHVARFSFGEPLPVLTHSLTDPDRPGLAYDLLAEILSRGFADAGSIIDPTYRPQVDSVQVRSLNNPRNLGEREKGLAALTKVVESYRQRLDVSRPSLAAALRDLAKRLSDLGRPEEALAATAEAVDIYRFLVAQPPDAYRPDLAASLHELAERLSDLGRQKEALAAVEEELGVYRLLATERFDAYRPNLATCLQDISNRLADLGQREAALDAIQEAVAIYGALATERPRVFSVRLGSSLQVLASVLHALGRHQEADGAQAEGDHLLRADNR